MVTLFCDLFSQDSEKYWVYSANTHRCKGKQKYIRYFPDANLTFFIKHYLVSTIFILLSLFVCLSSSTKVGPGRVPYTDVCPFL